MKKITGINYMLSDDEFTPTTIQSVTIPGDKTPPRGFLVCWYGTRDSLAALKEVRQTAKRKNKFLFRAEIVINGGDVPSGKIGLDDLSSVNFLNLGRLKIELRDYITDVILKTERPGKSNEDLYKDSIDLISEKPKRLEYLKEDQKLKHLTGIVWPAPIPGSIRKFEVRQLMAIDLSEPYELIVRNFQGDIEQISIIPS